MAGDAAIDVELSDDEEWWRVSSQTLEEHIEDLRLRSPPRHAPPPPSVAFRLGLLERYPPLIVNGADASTLPICAPAVNEALVRHRFTVHGVDVAFSDPAPLDVQIATVDHLIESFQSAKDVIVESSTDTGKSSAYLCAALAFQLHCYGEGRSPPRIIVAARDPARLNYLASQLRATPYRPQTVTLGSKSALCSNETVRSSANLEDACAEACGQRKGSNSDSSVADCKQYANLSTRNALDVTDLRLKGPDPILDIEDLGRLGRESDACPFYMSRALTLVAHVVFMPFSLFLEQKGVFLSNHSSISDDALVIFDGAHQLIDFAKEQSSSSIALGDLDQVISSCDEYRRQRAQSAASAGAPDLSNIRLLASQLRALTLSHARDALVPAYDKEQCADYLTWTTFQPNVQFFNGIVSASRCDDALQSMTEMAMAELAIPFASDVFTKFRRVVRSIMLLLERASSYYVQIRRCSEAAERSAETVLSFNCIHPEMLLKRFQHATRSCVFIAPSLSPVRLFVAQLGEHLRLRLGATVLNAPVPSIRSQLLIRSLHKVSTDSLPLNGGLKNLQRNFPAYADGIGDVIVNLAQTTPHGVIVLLPSFKLLDLLHTHWFRTAILAKLERTKRRVFFDSSDLGPDFRIDMMANFAKGAKGSLGAILFTTFHNSLGDEMLFHDIR
jgi:Rad3-related DNA helicase